MSSGCWPGGFLLASVGSYNWTIGLLGLKTTVMPLHADVWRICKPASQRRVPRGAVAKLAIISAAAYDDHPTQTAFRYQSACLPGMFEPEASGPNRLDRHAGAAREVEQSAPGAGSFPREQTQRRAYLAFAP